MKLETLSGLELGSLVNKHEVSPTEVIKYFADRIETRNPSINAFTYTKIDEALEEAKMIEDKLLVGESVGKFAGVPIALKDFLSSKKGWSNSHGGVKSLIATDTCNSRFYSAAHKLGCIAVGKTNAPAFGFSGACGNKMYGDTRNPFDTSKTSGGSSGGTGAAVADGLIIMGEGGDAGGSIRIPSGWCNLFGYKPSLGTVPSVCRPDGLTATHPFCFNGVLTKTVADSVAILEEMAQYNPRDPISLPINSNKEFSKLMMKDIKGMKIAFTYDFDLYITDPEVRKIVRNSAEALTEAGAIVEDVTFKFKHTIEDILYCWAWSISLDSTLDIQRWEYENDFDLIHDHADELEPEFIKFYHRAARYDINDMYTYNCIRTDILDAFEDVFENYDIIVSPTACCSPFPIENHGKAYEIDGQKLDPDTNFIGFGQTPLANFIGYPAASIPAGLTHDHLPIGMQIIGKQYKDEDVLAVSKTYETLRPWNYDIPFNREIPSTD